MESAQDLFLKIRVQTWPFCVESPAHLLPPLHFYEKPVEYSICLRRSFLESECMCADLRQSAVCVRVWVSVQCRLLCSAAVPLDFRRPAEEEALVREQRTSMLMQTGSFFSILQDPTAYTHTHV